MSLPNNSSLVLYIFRLLKMTNPFVNMLYYILLGKYNLKRTKFKMQRISDEYFDMLLSKSECQQDLLGDKRLMALCNVNSLAALSISSSSWIKIIKPNQNTIAHLNNKDKVDWKVFRKQFMPNNCDMIDEETLDDEEEGFLIQCIAASTISTDFHLYVTEQVFFNIKHHLGFDMADLDLIEIEINSNLKGYRPEVAATAIVAAINSPIEIVPNDLEDVLQEYFSKPKYLRKEDCFSVDLKKNAPQLTYNATYQIVFQINFKVIDLADEKGHAVRQRDRGYYLAKNFTTLYLDSPVPGYLIPKSCIYVNGFSSKSDQQLSICPQGLKKHFDLVKKMLLPFFQNDGCKAKPIFLLSGAHGSGKKTVLRCISQYFGLHVLEVDCFDFFGAGSSVAEAKFEIITSKVKKLSPCLLRLNNIELIGRDRDQNEDVRLVNAFHHHVKELFSRQSNYPTFVIGTTDSKPSELLPSVARTFLKTLLFETPKPDEAYANLLWFAAEAGMTCRDQDLKRVSEKTTGFVFADLALLFRHALEFQRREEKSEKHRLLLRHFEKGLEIMESAYSDSIGAAKVPTVLWEDVGGLEDLKEEIMVTLNLPLKHPELFASGLKRSGILFYGPPGTGKTLMAKAVATECNFNFLSVKGPELMNMYVGQSERNVREVFERARDASPCIIFFDELDSLAPNRGKSGDSGGVTDRVVSQLLAEMDGLQENNRVFVVAATNRPDLVDPALLRPGRFDKMFYVGVCDSDSSKLSVIKALTRKFSLDENVNFENLISKLPGHVTGADIYSVCSNAWLGAARRTIEKIEKGISVSIPIEVASDDFEVAIKEFVPSLSLQDISYYQKLKSLER